MTCPSAGAARVFTPGILVILGVGAVACAGAQGTTPGAQDPGAALTQRLQALNGELATDIQGITDLYGPLAERVRGLPNLPDTVARTDLEPDIVRSGLQSCFSAPGEGPCNSPEVTRLLDWAAAMGPGMQAMVEDKVAQLSFLRSALGIVIERSPSLIHRMAEARVHVERLLAQGYDVVERTEENPLEAAHVKDAARAAFAKLMKEKETFEGIAARVEQEVRPLPDQAISLHQQVVATLQRFGDSPAGGDLVPPASP